MKVKREIAAEAAARYQKSAKKQKQVLIYPAATAEEAEAGVESFATK